MREMILPERNGANETLGWIKVNRGFIEVKPVKSGKVTDRELRPG